jgi:hypothetical protein
VWESCGIVVSLCVRQDCLNRTVCFIITIAIVVIEMELLIEPEVWLFGAGLL